MSEQNVNTVRDSYAAFGRGDFAAVLESMDAAIEWVDPESLPWGGSHRGHEEFSRHMQSFAGNFEELHIEPQEFLDAGDRVVVLGRFAGRASGREFDAPSVWVWQLRDGKVVRVGTQPDTAAVLEALRR